MPDSVSLVLENISKNFGKKTVLDGLSYTFKGGKLYAIVGESGSGKTTLLNIIGLLDNHYQGNIFINGQLIDKKTDHCRERNKFIGFIFQSYYLIDYLNVLENITMPSRYSDGNIDREYLEYLCSELNIADLIEENVNYLSGGEKQRIAIARALINKPTILICDEPTGNLDQKNADQVVEILKKFLQDDRIIIIVTHSPELAALCDLKLSLTKGNIYEA